MKLLLTLLGLSIMVLNRCEEKEKVARLRKALMKNNNPTRRSNSIGVPYGISIVRLCLIPLNKLSR